MKKIYVLALALIPTVLFSQTVFWTENFGGLCNPVQLATAYSGANGSWTITSTGTNDQGANAWYIGASENGNAVGQCGSGCGNNGTLYLSSTIINALSPFDPGERAVYFELGPLCALFGTELCSATDKRVESPTINCTGRTSISINFKYIEGGNATDNATLMYSANGGTNWTQIADMNKTLACSDVDGIWTSFSFALPASADNNPNVKIGFRWVNANDGEATDPSFAVDDITLTVPDVVDCCPGDFNCDGVVNVLDMIIIVNQFGCAAGCTADLDNDGIIGAADLTIFNGLYSDICP